MKRKQFLFVVVALCYSILVPRSGQASCHPECTIRRQGSVVTYDRSSGLVTIKGKDWEQKAKVGSNDADAKKNLLKEGTKVAVEFEVRGAGDVRVKSIGPR